MIKDSYKWLIKVPNTKDKLHLFYRREENSLTIYLPVQEIDNIWVFQLLHHQDLIDDELLLGLLLEVNLFNGHLEINEKMEIC